MVERGYRPCGRGKVIEHKRKGSKEIEVIPLDDQPYQDGESISDIFTLEAQGKDASGKSYSAKVNTSKSIMAMWLSTDANRMTAPDVRRGDIVELYTFYDTQQYYWKEAEDNGKRRRMEQVTHRYSATDDESVKELDDSNSIKIDLNGETGTYTISLPKIGKSKVSQTIQFDTQNGNIVIADSNENFIQIEEAGKVSIANSKGSYREFDLETIRDVSPEEITHETKKYSVTCTTYNLTATTSAGITAPKVTLNAATSITFSTPKMTCTGAASFGSTAHVTGQLSSPKIDTGVLLASSINCGPIACGGISFGGSGGSGGSGEPASPGSGGGAGSSNNSRINEHEVYLEHPRQEFKANEFTVDSDDIKLGEFDVNNGTITKGGLSISENAVKVGSATLESDKLTIGNSTVSGTEVNTETLNATEVKSEDVTAETLKATESVDLQVNEFKLHAAALDIDQNTLTALATLLKPILDTL